MADYGIKVLKPNAPSNVDVKNAEPRYLTILSTAESHKAVYVGSLSSSQNYFSHNLGYIPFFDAFGEKSNGNLIPSGFCDLQISISPEMVQSYIGTNSLYLGGSTTKYYRIYVEQI